jgi:glycosyltransferase involved in cell wall biosynthesis
MATYNGGDYLQAQLDSFVSQARRPDELVVCDDGSTDGTLARLDAFASAAPFLVRIERNEERLGYNGNFAKAIGLCSGNLIFVSDQDDQWYADKIERVVAAFDGDARALVVTNDQMITDGSGVPAGVTVLHNVRRLGSPDALFGPGCCTALRREALPLLLPFPSGTVPYDHWITTLPVLLDSRILLEVPLQTYRRHESNTSGSVFSDAGASVWKLASAAHRRGQKDAFASQVAMIEVFQKRLDERRPELETLGLIDRVPVALAELHDQKKAYSSRLEALGSNRAIRVFAIARLLLAGRYRRFQGIKSALKDLVT